MTSILENDYVEASRPYSQHELEYNKEKLYRDLRLSKHRACHARCGHHYLVRVNGRKEREMIETKSDDVGNCSVCWTLSKTPGYLKNKAQDIAYHYTDKFGEDTEFLTYENNDLEATFYVWLYLDNQEKPRRRRREDRGPPEDDN